MHIEEEKEKRNGRLCFQPPSQVVHGINSPLIEVISFIEVVSLIEVVTLVKVVSLIEVVPLVDVALSSMLYLSLRSPLSWRLSLLLRLSLSWRLSLSACFEFWVFTFNCEDSLLNSIFQQNISTFVSPILLILVLKHFIISFYDKMLVENFSRSLIFPLVGPN